MTPEGLLRERHADTHAHRKTETQPHTDTSDIQACAFTIKFSQNEIQLKDLE